MVYRTRIKYTAAQKADIWDRWQRGDSLKEALNKYRFQASH
jgi:hypothetical protein